MTEVKTDHQYLKLHNTSPRNLRAKNDYLMLPMSDITGDNLYWTAGAHHVESAGKVKTNNDL